MKQENLTQIVVAIIWSTSISLMVYTTLLHLENKPFEIEINGSPLGSDYKIVLPKEYITNERIEKYTEQANTIIDSQVRK